MRMNFDKKTFIYVGFGVFACIVLSLVVYFFIIDDGSSGAVQQPAPTVDESKKEQKVDPRRVLDPDVSSAVKKDTENQQKKGTEIGKIDDKKNPFDLDKKPVSAQDVQNATMQPDKPKAQMQPSDFEKADPRKNALWALVNGHKIDRGGFVATEAPKQVQQVVKNTAPTSQDLLGLGLEPYRKYRAKVMFTVQNGSRSAAMVPFVAEITEPGNFSKWKAMGSVSPDPTAGRLAVQITSLTSPSYQKYPIQGFATMMDETPGVVSSVRHDDLKYTQVSTGLTILDGIFQGLRKDETVVTQSLTGDQTTQKKDSNRTREAILQGSDQGIQDLRTNLTAGMNKQKVYFLEKNTPILLFFTF